MSVPTIFRATSRISISPRERVLFASQRTLVRNAANSRLLTRTLTSTVQPRGKSTHWRCDIRTLATAASAFEAIPSVQQATADLPIANADDRKITIQWAHQNWSRFHHIWLRDHCRCPDCFHPISKQRLLDTFKISPDIKPHRVQSSAEGLEVVWPASSTEYHTSFYPWSWLKGHTYDPQPESRSKFGEKVLWGPEIAKSPPTVTYAEVMDESDEGLCKWLSNIDRFGFCLVSGVPATTEATEELSYRIGFVRETHFGKFWEIKGDFESVDTAYTPIALGAHTDNTYFTDPIGVQLLHILSHTEGSGGASLLVDGFHVASLLKQLYPDAYELLSRIPIPAHSAGEPGTIYKPNLSCGYPPLGHDPVSGDLVQVRWNNDDRSVMDHVEGELIEPWYDAVRKWHALLTSKESEYWFQLKPGTVLSINNQRVLHGRSAFTGKRRLYGTYIGMGEYKSRLAVLKERISGGQRDVWSNGL